MSLPPSTFCCLTRRIWNGNHSKIGVIRQVSQRCDLFRLANLRMVPSNNISRFPQIRCFAQGVTSNKNLKNPDKISSSVVQPRIVIIGAGVAGLMAAKHLANSGITNFTVLEGSERPGGRIHSCTVGRDTVAELGAQWIKGGSQANPIFTLACSEGLLKEPLLKRASIDSSGSLLCLTSDGRFMDSEVRKAGIRVFRTLKDQAISLFTTESSKGHGTLKHFFTARASEEISQLPQAVQCDVNKVVNGLLNRLKGRWGDDLHKMSSDSFGCFTNIPGDAVSVPPGFVSILGPMIREIPSWAIKYDTEVNSIRWGCGDPRAVVRTCDGQEIPADYVIVTVPLGVLKEKIETLFQPTLPESKIQAIQNLGYGHSNKIILEYSQPFWLEGEGTLLFSWSADELEAKNSWVKGVSALEEVPGSRNMLMATVGGQEAIEMEQATEDEVAGNLTDLLHQFTGDTTIPLPVNLFRSKWSSSRFSNGTTTYMTVNSSLTDICELSTPVVDSCNPGPPILFFAGEATSSNMYSTVQGARESGLREAGRIVTWTKKLNGPPSVSCA